MNKAGRARCFFIRKLRLWWIGRGFVGYDLNDAVFTCKHCFAVQPDDDCSRHYKDILREQRVVAVGDEDVRAVVDRLEEVGLPGAEKLVPATFLVILFTVAVYGLTGRPVARLLGLQDDGDPDPAEVPDQAGSVAPDADDAVVPDEAPGPTGIAGRLGRLAPGRGDEGADEAADPDK